MYMRRAFGKSGIVSKSLCSPSFTQPEMAVPQAHVSAMMRGIRAMSCNTAAISKKNFHSSLLKHPNTHYNMRSELSHMPVLSFCVRNYHDQITKPTAYKNEFPGQKVNFSTLRQILPRQQHLFRDPVFRKIYKSMAGLYSIQERGLRTRHDYDMMERFESLMKSIKMHLGIMDNSRPPETYTKRQEERPLTETSILETPQDGTERTYARENMQQITHAFSTGYTAKVNEEGKEGGIKTVLKVLFYLWSSLYLLGKLFGNAVTKEPEYQVVKRQSNITFKDVKANEEAKQELQDVVDFLRSPEKYTSLGARLPKGVLLVGPPGTGKTRLARAVAGEAGVSFIHASGSEFDDMYAGTGAKKVRQLFDTAKQSAPCIIFIDEFDSVGSKRVNSAEHPYANQTVNQMLTEMDGFARNEGIMVMAATNKVDSLDKALRRAGRFDVEVTVGLPDYKGRKEILEYYLGKVKTDGSVNVGALARATSSFSGAELENIVNQAALRAVQEGRFVVTMEHLEWAREKRLMGAERKYQYPDDELKLGAAFHEAGHTVVAYNTEFSPKLHKVTILPRGDSLVGETHFLDDREQLDLTMLQLLARMDVMLGGRAAEELMYGPDKVSTGIYNDLTEATTVAVMLINNGYSEKVGMRFVRDPSDLSPVHREVYDQEIQRILEESYSRVKKLLTEHKAELVSVAKALMKYETLDRDHIKAAIESSRVK